MATTTEVTFIDGFEPNLIPNNGKDGKFGDKEREAVIERNGGMRNYRANRKKDGVRLQFGAAEKIISRSLKQPRCKQLLERFDLLQKECVKYGVMLEGEYYKHGLSMNMIMKFYSKADLHDPKYLAKLLKMQATKPISYERDYGTRPPEFYTTMHDDLKFWMFDGFIIGEQHLGYEERMENVMKIIKEKFSIEALQHFVMPCYRTFDRYEDVVDWFNDSIEYDWEGVVLTHKDHVYKLGRNTLKDGTLLKMKDDKKEYDGIVLGVEEGTMAKEGAERQEGKFGKTTTSRKKEDREPNGKAKGFTVQFEGVGTFCVGLQGFDDEDKRMLLENDDLFIGRHFIYTGMRPLKDFPRHAYFKTWRDEK